MKINNIAELKTRRGTTGSNVNVLGYYSSGDGGGGEFYWDNTSIETDNGGTIIKVTALTTGRWKRIINSGFVSINQFGAKPHNSFDNTTFISNAILFSVLNGYTVTGRSGNYNISDTITKSESFDGINCDFPIGAIFNFTSLTANIPMIKIIGGSGRLCNSTIKGIYFKGLSNQVGVEIDGQCGQRFLNCKFDNFSTAILLHNNTAGTFSEWNTCEGCEFINTFTALEYKVTSGDRSFHGSGFVGVNLINKIENTKPTIKIGAGCFPYNCPLNLQLWNNVACVFIENNSSSTNYCSFNANVTFEQFNDANVTLSTNTVYFTGFSQSLGDRVDATKVIFCRKLTHRNNGTLLLDGISYSQSKLLISEINTITFPVPNVYTYLVIVKLTAPNYDYRYSFIMEHDGYGSSGYIANLSTIRAFNGNGYGSPTFTVNTNGQLVISNTFYDAGDVIALISYNQLSYYNPTNIPTKDF